jgi:alpha-galactosidase
MALSVKISDEEKKKITMGHRALYKYLRAQLFHTHITFKDQSMKKEKRKENVIKKDE